MNIHKEIKEYLQEQNCKIKDVILCKGKHLDGFEEPGIIIKLNNNNVALFKSEIEYISNSLSVYNEQLKKS